LNTGKILEGSEALAPACIARIISGGQLPTGGGAIWRLGNELKPSDLYCYLYARFGPPNGLQNLFRSDDSDNLIHWDWTLANEHGLVMILGLNLRSEVHLLGEWTLKGNYSLRGFVEEVKSDLASHGKEMSRIRKEVLEDWEMFVNPFKNLRESIDSLKNELDSLTLNPDQEELPDPTSVDEFQAYREKFGSLVARYDRGVGLSMALRFMVPVLAESFINLLIFVLSRPDIKSNPRLYENFVRSNIDVKIQSLHINCIGFVSALDWSSPECAQYNSIVNERNDLLHGNFAVGKLKFNEVFFNGKVPVFKEYRSMWAQSVGVSIEASGVHKVSQDISVVGAFIDYVLSHLEPVVREQVIIFMEKRDLGRNKANSRLGVLFPDTVADFGVSVAPAHTEQNNDSPAE
jgi:hypothetical protein